MCYMYRETFAGENFANWWIFVEKTFVDCSMVLPIVPLEDATPPNFGEKTLQIATKP